MKKILFIIFVSILSTSIAMADTIYFKDGSLIRGKITAEDDRTIFLEMADAWKPIRKSDVERVIKDETTPSQSKPPISMPPSGLQPMPPPEMIIVQPPPPPPQHMGFYASRNMDLRIKFGSAVGADEVEVPAGTTTVNTDKHGGNVQVEWVVSPAQGSIAGPVFGVGFFGRQHSGKIDDPTRSTKVDYDAAGVSLAGGLRLKSSERFHFELKVEVGLGSGGVTMDSPSYGGSNTRDDTYSSAALIAGWYYSFSKPGFQLGLELGAQSFTGDFQIRNSMGRWDTGRVTGSGGTANATLGFHF